jgi:hypothetical protein
MATFSPQQTVATFGAITAQGEMDGEFFTAKFRTAAIELHVGSKGFTTFVESADLTGEVTWMLSQESPTNRELSLAFAAKLPQMLQMEDLNNGTLVTGPNARIESHAEIKRGNKVVGLEWKFLVPKMTMVAGGDQ